MYIHSQKVMSDSAEIPLVLRANIELQPTIIIVRTGKKAIVADLFPTTDGRRLIQLMEYAIETGLARMQRQRNLFPQSRVLSAVRLLEFLKTPPCWLI
jgi:hypothetical protein